MGFDCRGVFHEMDIKSRYYALFIISFHIHHLKFNPAPFGKSANDVFFSTLCQPACSRTAGEFENMTSELTVTTQNADALRERSLYGHWQIPLAGTAAKCRLAKNHLSPRRQIPAHSAWLAFPQSRLTTGVSASSSELLPPTTQLLLWSERFRAVPVGPGGNIYILFPAIWH